MYILCRRISFCVRMGLKYKVLTCKCSTVKPLCLELPEFRKPLTCTSLKSGHLNRQDASRMSQILSTTYTYCVCMFVHVIIMQVCIHICWFPHTHTHCSLQYGSVWLVKWVDEIKCANSLWRSLDPVSSRWRPRRKNCELLYLIKQQAYYTCEVRVYMSRLLYYISCSIPEREVNSL